MVDAKKCDRCGKFYIDKEKNMKEVTGKYGTAKIFTDLVDEKSIEQVKTLMDQEIVEGCQVRMMPDIHAGAGCVIGTTMQVHDKVCPNLVGVDIGCGMLTVVLGKVDINLEKLDKVIHEKIPAGFNKRDAVHECFANTNLEKLICKDHVDINNAALSLGTLGGGNHFIEIDKDDEGILYLVIHSGSRHLGLEVAKYYQGLAEEYVRDSYEMDYQYMSKVIVHRLRNAGEHFKINSELKKLKDSLVKPPKELSYLQGLQLDDYIHDMTIVQDYASWNRIVIAHIILQEIDLSIPHYFETIHNYIDTSTENVILRKGAVSAKEGELLLIPINMRDGSLICGGKGNPDWNYSAPHGAGRLMSRSEAKKKVSVGEFTKSMEGVYTTSVNEDTLDECPMAYKPMESIVSNIGDTVDILRVIKPVYNFKASEMEDY